MAQIDMKNAYLKLQDGGRNYTKTGTVTGINAIGTTVLAVTMVGAVETGGTIEVGTNVCTIASHSETGANTTSITVAAPGLTQATTAGQAITAYGKVESITIKVGEGTVTYSEKRNIQYTLDRGVLDEVREGDEVPVDVKFDLIWEYIKGTTGAPTAEDCLKKIGEAATWRSSDTDACRPFALDIVIEYIPACTGDPETITLPDFRYESLDHDLKAGTISCTGKCNATEASSVRG
jgi:hypothetical protein